jgi:biopolymer transport protein ExbD
MAEINSNARQQGGGKVRAKKQSTKIDMTPMVDLAFLLLTFFILTTTFNKTRVLPVLMPDKVTNASSRPEITADNVLNLVLAEHNKIYWWTGFNPVQETNYSAKGIRKVLLQEIRSNPKLMVLIKPKNTSKYQNIVDVVDEMDITSMTRYAIVDFKNEDAEIIARHSQLTSANRLP